MPLVETPPLCPHGHRYVAGRVLVGWHPCNCRPDGEPRGHRTYWCRDHGVLQNVPACSSTDRTVAEQGIRTR